MENIKLSLAEVETVQNIINESNKLRSKLNDIIISIVRSRGINRQISNVDFDFQSNTLLFEYADSVSGLPQNMPNIPPNIINMQDLQQTQENKESHGQQS